MPSKWWKYAAQQQIEVDDAIDRLRIAANRSLSESQGTTTKQVVQAIDEATAKVKSAGQQTASQSVANQPTIGGWLKLDHD